MTGADLANLANQAALTAARRGASSVTDEDLGDALEKIQLGAERDVVVPAEERRRTAYHEAGHALLGMIQPGADPVRKVPIIPRGRALGITLSTPETDRYGYGVTYLRDRIIGALGGMAAEQEVFGVVTTGAESDLETSTRIARAMAGRWGMSERIGRSPCCRARVNPARRGCPTGCSTPSFELLMADPDSLLPIVRNAPTTRSRRRPRRRREHTAEAKGVEMIIAAHTVVFAEDAEQARAFFRDVLDLPNVDAGGGWLIFRSPPAELAVHPSEPSDSGRHALYLVCDDIDATIAELATKGVTCSEVNDEGWGLLTSFPVPGAGTMGLYQAKHSLAHLLPD